MYLHMTVELCIKREQICEASFLPWYCSQLDSSATCINLTKLDNKWPAPGSNQSRFEPRSISTWDRRPSLIEKERAIRATSSSSSLLMP